MGGLRLEAFKFGLYLTVPIFALLHFGDPEWYRTNVVPVSSFLCQPRRISIAIPSIGINCFLARTGRTQYVRIFIFAFAKDVELSLFSAFLRIEMA
jgi:hypothetical protein